MSQPAGRSGGDQPRHLDRRERRVVAGIPLVAAGAGQRLVHVLDRQHAEGARHAGVELGRAIP